MRDTFAARGSQLTLTVLYPTHRECVHQHRHVLRGLGHGRVPASRRTRHARHCQLQYGTGAAARAKSVRGVHTDAADGAVGQGGGEGRERPPSACAFPKLTAGGSRWTGQSCWPP
jgi:hypothetical protein